MSKQNDIDFKKIKKNLNVSCKKKRDYYLKKFRKKIVIKYEKKRSYVTLMLLYSPVHTNKL